MNINQIKNCFLVVIILSFLITSFIVNEIIISKLFASAGIISGLIMLKRISNYNSVKR